jgi:hypothetical protein
MVKTGKLKSPSLTASPSAQFQRSQSHRSTPTLVLFGATTFRCNHSIENE